MSTSLIDSPVCLPQVTEDVEEDNNHEGYWMRLDQWNRFRHDTYKNCREDELQYITNGVSTVIAPATSEGVLDGVPTKTTFVYKFFKFVTTEEHVVRLGQHAGKTRNCALYACNLCLKSPTLKVFGGSTGGLFKHLKSFHPAEHTEARRASNHSRLQVSKATSTANAITSRFPRGRHTGPALARQLTHLLRDNNLDMDKHITLPTLDGASNNKSAFKVLGKKFKVCGPHQLQRSVQYGLGNAGKRKNKSLLSHISKNAKQSRSFHSSVLHSERLEKSQLSRGAKRVKNVLRQHVIRWSGIYKMLKNGRHLEGDIKYSLTGSRNGVCGEAAAFVEPTEHEAAVETGGADVETSEDENAGESDVDSDFEQVEANECEGKEYPLSHRCLAAPDWTKNNQLESVFAPLHDVSVDLQSLTGAGLDKEHVLSEILHRTLTAGTVDVVSGAGQDETWTRVHADTLPADIQQFREVTATQVQERMINMDEDTLLALKMNPSIDTSAEGQLFKDKRACYELMESVYNRQLRKRGMHLWQKGHFGSNAAGGAFAGGSSSEDQRGSTVARAEGTDRSVKKRRTISENASAFRPATVSSLAQDIETAVAEKIRLEKETFASRCMVAMESGKYTLSNGFDQVGFYSDLGDLCPIHSATFRADACSKKAASANVESVFSGASALLADFHAGALSPKMICAYMFIRVNWQYAFLRPSVEEIVKAYISQHGSEGPAQVVSEDEESETDM
ncbi:hypothetical protein CYMTET_7249 [Cymbomonas tetramitiformis]|uniref:Uncharacterized protein n=1 Tax=Cymbomonas tetramitiformis TaxID=36881 RepID=A0AAE0GW16_9CHLO|nr:hypothetical protein CYMTET_46488 [Cymbomonas tetramitiformis]KAK3285128.1 hypothetical protein CYMTET_7249 [Cymbomonas tetramitiformis]